MTFDDHIRRAREELARGWIHPALRQTLLALEALTTPAPAPAAEPRRWRKLGKYDGHDDWTLRDDDA